MSRKRHILTPVVMGREGGSTFTPQASEPRPLPVCNSTTERDYRFDLSAPVRPGSMDAFSIPSYAMGKHITPRKPNNAA